jgi:hypothetical protein
MQDDDQESEDSGSAVGFRTLYLRTAYLARHSYINLLVSLIIII